MLLVSQDRHGVRPGGPKCGDAGRHEGSEHQKDGRPSVAHRVRGSDLVQEGRCETTGRPRQSESHEKPCTYRNETPRQHLPMDAPGVGTQSHAHGHLPHPVPDCVADHAVESHHRQGQGESGEATEKPGQKAVGPQRGPSGELAAIAEAESRDQNRGLGRGPGLGLQSEGEGVTVRRPLQVGGVEVDRVLGG